jgi:hypothetical protein
VRVREVKRLNGHERWTLDATSMDRAVTVYADVIAGRAYWLQWDADIEPHPVDGLVACIRQHVERVLQHHEVTRQLDAIGDASR